MIRLLIADDEHLIRGALVSLLNLEDDIEVVAEASTSDGVIEQARAHGEGEGFFPGLIARAAEADVVDEELAARIQVNAEAAAQAYRDFAQTLETELRPHAPEQDAVGRELYSLGSRMFLGATVDLEETYRWGQEELARIIAEQEAIAEQLERLTAAIQQVGDGLQGCKQASAARHAAWERRTREEEARGVGVQSRLAEVLERAHRGVEEQREGPKIKRECVHLRLWRALSWVVHWLRLSKRREVR